MSNYRYIQKTLFLKIDTDTGGPIVARDGMLAGNSADKISLSNYPLTHSQFFNLNIQILWVRVLKEWSQ